MDMILLVLSYITWATISATVSVFVAILFGLRYLRIRRERINKHRYTVLRIKRLGGGTLSDEDWKFFKNYKPRTRSVPFLRKTKREISRRVKVTFYPIRNWLATIYSDNNPLALRDRITDLEKDLNHAKYETKMYEQSMWQYKRKVKIYEEHCPEEKERQEKEEKDAKKKMAEETREFRDRNRYITDFI